MSRIFEVLGKNKKYIEFYHTARWIRCSAAGSCERHAIPSADEFNALSSKLGIVCRSQDPAALHANPPNSAVFITLPNSVYHTSQLATKISICGRVRIPRLVESQICIQKGYYVFILVFFVLAILRTLEHPGRHEDPYNCRFCTKKQAKTPIFDLPKKPDLSQIFWMHILCIILVRVQICTGRLFTVSSDKYLSPSVTSVGPYESAIRTAVSGTFSSSDRRCGARGYSVASSCMRVKA
jgi:hypothetical protein